MSFRDINALEAHHDVVVENEVAARPVAVVRKVSPSIQAMVAQQQAALRIFRRLLRGYKGCAGLRLWNNSVYTVGINKQTPDFTLVVRDPAVLREWVLERDPLVLVEAYFQGRVDVEGDLYKAIALQNQRQFGSLNWREMWALWRDAWRLPDSKQGNALSRIAQQFSRRHSKSSDREAIAFHYDVSNEFYALWLDQERVYSCAYFTQAEDSLDQAQRNKLDHICRKLRLKPGERFLDVGCGWGALICWAAKHYGVSAHGITLSQNQYDYVQKRIQEEGLEDFVTVELRDYRDLEGTDLYDKVSSVGMFEHVGLRNLPTYFATIQRVLRPGGLFLNHGITHDEEGWNPTLATRFINRYVFPDGELDCVSNIQRGMERSGFEIHDVEGLRPHYALTLRNWVKRLEANRTAALREIDEPTYRVWRLYMAACALEFESGGTGIYQVLASKRDDGRWSLPMTRADLYQ